MIWHQKSGHPYIDRMTAFWLILYPFYIMPILMGIFKKKNGKYNYVRGSGV